MTTYAGYELSIRLAWASACPFSGCPKDGQVYTEDTNYPLLVAQMAWPPYPPPRNWWLRWLFYWLDGPRAGDTRYCGIRPPDYDAAGVIDAAATRTGVTLTTLTPEAQANEIVAWAEGEYGAPAEDN